MRFFLSFYWFLRRIRRKEFNCPISRRKIILDFHCIISPWHRHGSIRLNWCSYIINLTIFTPAQAKEKRCLIWRLESAWKIQINFNLLRICRKNVGDIWISWFFKINYASLLFVAFVYILEKLIIEIYSFMSEYYLHLVEIFNTFVKILLILFGILFPPATICFIIWYCLIFQYQIKGLILGNYLIFTHDKLVIESKDQEISKIIFNHSKL